MGFFGKKAATEDTAKSEKAVKSPKSDKKEKEKEKEKTKTKDTDKKTAKAGKEAEADKEKENTTASKDSDATPPAPLERDISDNKLSARVQEALALQKAARAGSPVHAEQRRRSSDNSVVYDQPDPVLPAGLAATPPAVRKTVDEPAKKGSSAPTLTLEEKFGKTPVRPVDDPVVLPNGSLTGTKSNPDMGRGRSQSELSTSSLPRVSSPPTTATTASPNTAKKTFGPATTTADPVRKSSSHSDIGVPASSVSGSPSSSTTKNSSATTTSPASSANKLDPDELPDRRKSTTPEIDTKSWLAVKKQTMSSLEKELADQSTISNQDVRVFAGISKDEVALDKTRKVEGLRKAPTPRTPTWMVPKKK